MRRSRASVVLGVLAVGVGLLAGCAEQPKPAACEAVEGSFSWASPAPDEDARFDLTGPGWIGGDSTYSVALPDGRTLWLFSDSFIGEVTAGGAPKPGMAMVHNALITEDDAGRLSTRTRKGPESFFPDPSEQSYYWVQDATVEGERLIVFLSETRRVGEEGFAWERNTLATVSLPDLTTTEITPLPAVAPGAPGIAWGAGILTTATYTYIYGVEDLEQGKHLYLARVPAGNLTDPNRWEYLGEDGWSPKASTSTRLASGVANELSVTPHRDGYLMISSDTSAPFSPQIVAWTACSPQGPWTKRQTIYETPESRVQDHFTYNAHAHAELSDDGSLLISYNVNTFDFEELNSDPTLYRPSFITLDTG